MWMGKFWEDEIFLGLSGEMKRKLRGNQKKNRIYKQFADAIYDAAKEDGLVQMSRLQRFEEARKRMDEMKKAGFAYELADRKIDKKEKEKKKSKKKKSKKKKSKKKKKKKNKSTRSAAVSLSSAACSSSAAVSSTSAAASSSTTAVSSSSKRKEVSVTSSELNRGMFF